MLDATPTKLLLAAALAVVLAGPSAAEDPPEDRQQLAAEIAALREQLNGTVGEPRDPAGSAELGLLERLDSLLVRKQALIDDQARLTRAEAAMQTKLSAGPASDVSDTPPYPVALLDLLGDAVDALAQRSEVLARAEEAATDALEQARRGREGAERERRRVLEEADRREDPIERARATAALRVAEIELRIARTRERIAELELDGARRDRALHESNLSITRAALEFVEERLDLTPELREQLLLGLTERELNLRSERERTTQDLERAQARRLAAEQRRDRVEQVTPVMLAEADALAAQHETLQLELATLGRQEERLERVRELRERRYRALAGEATRPEMRGWEGELRGFVAELDRRRQVEEGRIAKARALRDELEERASRLPGTSPAQRWLAEHEQALAGRVETHRVEIADLQSARTHATRFQAELARRTERMSVEDQLEIAATRAEEVWETELASFDERPITLGKVATAIAVLILGLFAARFLSRWIARFSARRMALEEGATAAFQSLSYYVLVVLFLLIALRSANIPLTVFTILGGAFAIGVGFGSQNVIANFLSGIILLVERPIKVGDLIEVDGTLGRVEGIGLRATRVRTFANIHIVIPNSAFLEKNVINWNLRDDIVRGQVDVGVAYGSDTRSVERLLLQAAGEQDLVLGDPEPSVLFLEFGDNALGFRLFFWIRARNVLDRVRIESDLRYRIDELFRESEVVIAFPQRDVHLDTTTPLQLEWRGPGPDRGPEA